MENQQILKKRPTAIGTLFHGFKSGKHRTRIFDSLPEMNIAWNRIKLNPGYLKSFCKICNLRENGYLPLLYPFTFLYPVNLRLLSQKEARFPLFKMLTVRNSILIHRTIADDETLCLKSRTSCHRFMKKGTEFDIESILFSENQTVWENISTYFVPGKVPVGEVEHIPQKLDPIIDGETLDQWVIPPKNRFRFARILGDSNGIHFSQLYARAQGFTRDFAHPVRAACRALEKLPDLPGKGSLKLDLHFKGPAYYESPLVLKKAPTPSTHRFDICCGNEKRPCIAGLLKRV